MTKKKYLVDLMAKKQAKEKRFEIDVDIKFTNVIFANNKRSAKRQLIASFSDEYNLDLTDKEIVEIREVA